MSEIKSSVLYGAIIGDISGSPYERNPIKTKDYKFIRHRGHFTDDTVMTIAVADALLNCPGFNEDDVKNAVTGAMQFWGRKFPDKGYGHRFKNWLATDNPQPYKSFGNGAAMRVSAVALIGYISNHFDLVRDVARWTAEVTHNHPEAVKSAEAVASAINLAQHGVDKDEIKSYLENEFGYDLSRSLDEIRPTYGFEVAAAKSVPEAIIAFLESENFEDAIRNAVSLGGDADTQAAIAGSIAEAFYGVPDELKIKARKKLSPELLVILDEFNRVVRAQENCKELDGNEDIYDAMRFFRETNSPEELMKLLYTIHRRIQDDGCFIVPMEKVSEGDDSDNYKPLTVYNEQANITFMSVCTNFYAFEKVNREKALELKCTTTPIRNLLETCAEVNAKVQTSDAPANMGLAINPFSDEVFGFTPELIDVVLSHVDDTNDDSADDKSADDDSEEEISVDKIFANETSANETFTAEFSAEKSQAYKNLVAKAKARYREYNPKVKPSDDDKQRTREFAAKFADRQKFWDALKDKGLTWTQTTNENTTDMWAKNALSKAIACGFDPNAKVNLFAPTIDGVNICDEVNLYTYWQGFGYAKKTPRIKYLLVAQDWGNFFNAPDEFKSTVAKMNAGEDIFPAVGSDPTSANLVKLFKILGRDVTKPCEDVFFTNFCLGYRLGNNAGGMTKQLMMRDADLFRELCEILQPENILCLGRLTSECVCEALAGDMFKAVFNNAKNYNDFLDNKPQIIVPCSADKKILARVYALAHCGNLGMKNRPLDKQREDWQAIADEKRLDEAIKVFRQTNSPENEQRVLDEIYSRLKTDDSFVVALHEAPMEFDAALPIFQNMKSVFMRNKHDGKFCLAAFTNLLQFARFNESSERKFSFMFVPVQKLLTDCMSGGGMGDEIALNPNDENQFRLTRDAVATLLNR